MTGLIKAGAGTMLDRVRPFVFTAGAAAAPLPEPKLTALRGQCLALEAALAERDAAIEALTGKADAAFRDGVVAGREAGRAEADSRRDEALALLEDASARAIAAFARRLEAMDALAALLARTSLDTLFGDAGARAEIVCDLIRHQIDRLHGGTAVEIRVSAEDFDADAAAAIDAGARVAVSDALASGDCSIRLELGTLEAGIDQQWGVLRTALSAMAGEEAA